MNWRGGTYGSALLSKNEIYFFSIKTIGNWKNFRETLLEIRKEIALETGKIILGTGKKELEIGRPLQETT